MITIALGTLITSVFIGGFLFAILTGLGITIQTFAPEFDSAINSAITNFGTQVGEVYHVIPGADALINILIAILIITIGYFWARFGMFVFNITMKSGAKI